jgi:uncharacterized glyoxalase superfamily protein PhnB
MATKAKLLRAATYFPVANVGKSAEYYRRVFGFNTEYIAGDPPQFAIVSRDGLSIMLRLVPRPDLITPSEKQGGTWDAFFWVDNARALHAELKAQGATVVYGPMIQQAYNMEEFAVRDSDGHVLGFGQTIK